jgi:hypothetical protein
MKIFVQIAAYRDKQLVPTIEDCIKNAKKPENLIFCVAWQHDEDDRSMEPYKGRDNFIIIDIPYKESKGVCWARNLLQKEYRGEKYTLQLDSHHRFIKDWDQVLIKMYRDLQKDGVKKPIISSYLPSYFPEKDPEGRIMEPWSLNIERFLPEGAVFLRPSAMPKWKERITPFPSRFMSGHFIFTTGKFNKEVLYDPDFYFHGEETSLAARSFTHGYDLFSPHILVAWHEYSREGSPRHWDDHNTWSDKDKKSYARFRALFNMGGTEEKIEPEYGFGRVRTLEDYEKYAGLKFKTRQLHEETIREDEPPIKGNYEKGLKNKIKNCVSIYKGSLPEKDYTLFVVAMLDKEGRDLFRRDVGEEEIKRLLTENANDKFIHVWVDYEDSKLPYSSRFWPYSVSKGWCDRTEQIIKYE